MARLDQNIIRSVDPETVIANIRADMRSDFIVAPHYGAIFNRAEEDLWEQLQQKLRDGTYEPGLPITMSVPKERWFSRPGSILKPYDRFLYQALADNVADQIEASLDRSRTFSHVPSDEADQMFDTNRASWEAFQSHVSDICDESNFVLKADISHYFERLPQHNLINLMTATGCTPEVVRLLEEMLSAFRERNSFGIIQGVFPSDMFGNFFLSDFDAHCEMQEIHSARYVDDIYMGFNSEIDARRGLGNLVEILRKDGLHLNEHKTSIRPADEIIRDETAIDRIFDDIREEIGEDQSQTRFNPYGFDFEWDVDQDEEDNETAIDAAEIETATVERLMANIEQHPQHVDQIEKFCLPILRTANSDSAVGYVLQNLQEKPHQIRIYLSYLSTFVRTNDNVVAALEDQVNSEDSVSDYQRMFLLVALLNAPRINRRTVTTSIRWLQNRRISKETRAIAAIFAARHGIATQKRAIRTSYEDEPAEYVRSAILYASRYFTNVEKRTCKRAWGGHDPINALICKTI